MSRYAYLICPECRRILCLGKAIWAIPNHQRASPTHFHIGDSNQPPNWHRRELNQTVWKFLADHAGREIRVIMSKDLDELEDLEKYAEIGGDTLSDLSVAEYLAEWPGMKAGRVEKNR